MDVSYLVMISVLVVRRASFNDDFATSEAFKMSTRRFFGENGNLIIIVRWCVQASFFVGNVCGME